jgi:hypothetical protein
MSRSRESRYVIDTPIVFERRRRSSKKVSPALRDWHTTERHLTRAMKRTIRAADKGMGAYRKARRKAARRTRDGAIVDFIPNVVKGSSVAMRELALVPFDLLRATYTRQTRRIIRRSVRAAARITDDMLS